MHEEQRPNSTAAVAVQQNFDKQQIRWSFTDLFHSFMVVFRALCGEWVESMYDCIVVSGDKSSIVYFHALAFIGSFLVSYYFVIVFFSFHFWLLFLLLRLFNTWCECVCVCVVIFCYRFDALSFFFFFFGSFESCLFIRIHTYTATLHKRANVFHYIYWSANFVFIFIFVFWTHILHKFIIVIYFVRRANDVLCMPGFRWALPIFCCFFSPHECVSVFRMICFAMVCRVMHVVYRLWL